MRRPERFAESLREEILEIVGYELNDPRIQSVTVNEVVVTEDLRNAKVYVLVEGDDTEIKEAMKALQHAEKFVRQQVAINLNLRYAPQIHFARDVVEEKAGRIEQILEELKENGELIVEKEVE
jgi:ribosome-binding factor A